MRRGLVLGPFGGVRLVLTPGWLVILAVVVVALEALGVFPAEIPLAGRWLVALAIGVLFLGSLAAHELAHAIVARRAGVDVREVGLAVIGTQGELERRAHSPRSEMAIALAGPLVSLPIGAAFAALGLALEGGTNWPVLAVAQVGWLVGLSNLLLGGLNLLPGFPFDGGRLLRAIVWAQTGDFARAGRFATLAGRFLAYGLMVLGVLLILDNRVIDGIWLAILGWFLVQAARMGQRRMEVGQLLEGLLVRDVMEEEFSVVGPNLTLDTLLAQHDQSERAPVYPVTDEGALVGAIEIERVRRLPAARRTALRVGDIMTRLDRLHTVTGPTTVMEALASFDRTRADALPVVDEDETNRLVGMLTRDGLISALRRRRGVDRAEQPVQ